jgi:hypothetical protein
MARGQRSENHPSRKVGRSDFGGALSGAIYQGLRNSIAGGKHESEWAEYNEDPSAHAVMAIASEMEKAPGWKRIK